MPTDDDTKHKLAPSLAVRLDRQTWTDLQIRVQWMYDLELAALIDRHRAAAETRAKPVAKPQPTKGN